MRFGVFKPLKTSLTLRWSLFFSLEPLICRTNSLKIRSPRFSGAVSAVWRQFRERSCWVEWLRRKRSCGIAMSFDLVNLPLVWGPLHDGGITEHPYGDVWTPIDPDRCIPLSQSQNMRRVTVLGLDESSNTFNRKVPHHRGSQLIELLSMESTSQHSFPLWYPLIITRMPGNRVGKHHHKKYKSSQGPYTGT